MNLAPFALLFAALCAGTMGFAIQRGATCMVAAIDEAVTNRRLTRAAALAETAIWVAGGLLLLGLLGAAAPAPDRFDAGPLALTGGVLLGWGALINRACMFGTIARFGSGEWAYAATPVGFLFGCFTAKMLSVAIVPHAAPAPRPYDGLWMMLLLGAGLAFAAYRTHGAVAAARRRELATHVWSPHRATLVIGLTFVALAALGGAWTYTDWLIALARGGMRADFSQGALFAALLAGATIGGWTAGRAMSRRVEPGRVIRCLAGGFAMGLGGLLVPGGNDGLILVGLPFLHPYALLALAAMAVTIAGGLVLRGPVAVENGT